MGSKYLNPYTGVTAGRQAAIGLAAGRNTVTPFSERDFWTGKEQKDYGARQGFKILNPCNGCYGWMAGGCWVCRWS